MKAALLSAILGLALAASLTSARSTDFSGELDSSDISKAQGYAKSLIDVDEVLKAKLIDNEDPLANMEVVKELLESVSAVLHSAKHGAIKLLASLEDNSHECDQKSFRTLARNLVAVDYLEQHHGKWDTRVRAILNHYLARHAEHCSAHYEEAYRSKVGQVSQESLHRVEVAFDDLKRSNFYYYTRNIRRISERKMFLQMNLRLLDRDLPEAAPKIVRNLIREVKEVEPELWQSIKPVRNDAKRTFDVPKVPARVFEEYVFKPCAEYEKVLGEDLSGARLDTVLEVDDHKFMEDRLDLYKAIVQSRFCKLTLREKPKMTKMLNQMWEAKARDYL